MSALFQPRPALKVCAWFIFYFSASMQLLFTRLLLKTGDVQEVWRQVWSQNISLACHMLISGLSGLKRFSSSSFSWDAFMDSVEKPPQSSVAIFLHSLI